MESEMMMYDKCALKADARLESLKTAQGIFKQG